MICMYCGLQLNWADARVVTIIHPIAERGQKETACRDIDACNARVREQERQQKARE